MSFQKVDKTDSFRRLEALVDKFEPRIRDSFISAVNVSQSSTTLKELTELIEQGRITEALQISDSIPRSVGLSVDISFVETGRDTTNVISTIAATPVFFDQTNQRAVNAMRINRAKLIREFTQSQREAVQEAIIDGITRGLNPIDQARNFRGAIGLTRKQVQSVNNFRNLLQTQSGEVFSRKLRDRRFDSTIRNAISGKKPLTKTQIDRMVNRYRERFVKFRAETIGRTEALRSIHEANNTAFQQAIDEGAIQANELEREWHVTNDSSLRDSHSLMSNQKRAFGEPFLSGNGNNLMFPGDPSAPADDVVQCRCSVTTVFKS
mgnify:CR=1 FL=1